MKFRMLLFSVLLCRFFVPGIHAQVTDTSAQWTWINSSSALNNRGNAASMGVEAAGYMPPARRSHVSWIDTAGNLWLFGGEFNTSTNCMNDLWRFNMSTQRWMWVKGPFSASTDAGFRQGGNYGTKGVTVATTQPGGTRGAACWRDAAGKFWMFGGHGCGTTAGFTQGYINTLWKYDPATNMWTWVSGESTLNPAGNYGTKGVAAPTNQPRARGHEGGFACSWVDAQGNFWIFGGYGYDLANTTLGRLNDLWKYDPVADVWTWIGGSNTINEPGNYGTKGVAAASNYPGGRSAAACWKDADGKFWVFGGHGRDASGTEGRLNDLWRYDPVTNLWTWMHGSNTANTNGTYGTRGVPDGANTPGGRYVAAVGSSWIDVNGKFWLYGGNGFGDASITSAAYLEDVWRYDPVTNQWTWMKGRSNVTAATGVYGTSGTPAPGNHPGGRGMFVNWVDTAGNFWLFGGFAPSNSRSDMWRLAPIAPVLPAQPGPFTAAKPAVCHGETNVAYTVPAVGGAATYEWVYTGSGVTFSGGTSTTAPANNLTFSGSATGGTLRVRAVNGAGSGPYRDTTIVVNPLPVAASTNTGNQSICAGDSLLLSATPGSGVSYQWKNGTTNVGTNSATYYAKTAGNYTVTVTNTTTNCSATSTPATNLTVNPLPTAVSTNTGNRSVCAGDSLLLSATPGSGVTYQWKNGTTNVGTGPAYYARTNGSYTVTVTNTTTNCSATSTPATNLTVNPLPTVTSTNTGARSVCQGDSLLLSATASSGVSYEWRLGTIPVGTNATYYASTAGNYTVTVTNTTTNCSATSTPATVLTVNSLPSATVSVGGPSIVCTGDSVVLTAGTGTGYTYQWKNGTTNVGTGNNVYAAHVTGMYKVVVTDGGTGCRDSTQGISVVVHNRPVVSLGPGDTAFCDGGVVMLEVATQDTGLTYRWKNGGATIPLAMAYFLEIEETGVYRVVVGRAQVGNCEDSTNTVTVTVHPLPVAILTWDHELLHATPGYASYQWYAGGQPVAGATDSTFRPVSNGGYSVRIMDSNGCSSTSSVYNVTVGVEDVTVVAAQVRVYPNPAREVVYIDAPVPVNITLSGMDGRVLQQQTDVRILDIRSYAGGVYLLRVTSSDGVIIRNERIIKQGL